MLRRRRGRAQVAVLEPHAVLRAVVQAFDLLVAARARQPRRIAQPQFALAHGLARPDHRAGADEAVFLHRGAVQDARAHADQAQVLDGAGVEDGAVLDVAARVDAHAVDVAADHRAGPHRHVFAQSHVADEGAGRIHVGACAELG
ncbi:hypothetical protein A6R79_14145 [Xanthomonas translucens pv. translucens]|nr:hypothetical protein ATB54_11625 [Xanthomonas translucens]OAX58535.1 hypothetical protein A6R79_14145 [Xanthomonas translucens pv. translucens]